MRMRRKLSKHLRKLDKIDFIENAYILISLIIQLVEYVLYTQLPALNLIADYGLSANIGLHFVM